MNINISSIEEKRVADINIRMIGGEIINYREMRDDKLISTLSDNNTDFSFVNTHCDLFKYTAKMYNRELIGVENEFYYYISTDEKDLKKEALLKLKSEVLLMLMFLSKYSGETGQGCDFIKPDAIGGVNKERFIDYCNNNFLVKNAFGRIRESGFEKAYGRLKKQGFLFEKSGMIFLTEISIYIYNKGADFYYNVK